MAAEMKLNLKDAKLGLKVSRSSLTKANSEFDGACKELDRHKDAAMTKKSYTSSHLDGKS